MFCKVLSLSLVLFFPSPLTRQNPKVRGWFESCDEYAEVSYICTCKSRVSLVSYLLAIRKGSGCQTVIRPCWGE
ncbi:hypothetical protein DFH08DRAFT_863495 [Mycena albidolilacea]|uniref:Secreted protein n=1 Tax=Mycena albidolilacea TaxID=1033008 RepID=A0AAD7EUI0_9AGAR|nr:hypothetical protein DFH08DRAFT_863495 [Mycena albidolilacea]